MLCAGLNYPPGERNEHSGAATFHCRPDALRLPLTRTRPRLAYPVRASPSPQSVRVAARSSRAGSGTTSCCGHDESPLMPTDMPGTGHPLGGDQVGGGSAEDPDSDGGPHGAARPSTAGCELTAPSGITRPREYERVTLLSGSSVRRLRAGLSWNEDRSGPQRVPCASAAGS
jgi:hypothetical protein